MDRITRFFKGSHGTLLPRVAGIAVALLLVAGVAQAATTIGTSIATGGTLTVGSGGSAITSILFGTCTVTPGAVASGTSTTATCTATGAAAGDKVFVTPPTTGLSSENWLVPMGATASTNTITIQIMNASSTVAVTGAARTWSWMVVR